MKTAFFSPKQLEQLTKNEKSIVNLIIENPIVFCNSSIKQLASICKTSMAVISVLSKKLGFPSLKSFQFYVYHNYLSSQKINNNCESDSKFCDNKQQVLNSLNLYYQESLSQTVNLIDIDQVYSAAKIVFNSKKIYLYGAGSSQLAARELGINLQKLGFNAFCFSDFHNFLLISGQKSDACIILFSKSCTTKEIVFLLNEFEDKGKNLIIVTANKTLVSPNHLVLYYQTREQQNRFVSISSKVNQFFIADLIFFTIAQNLPLEFREKYQQNLDLLGQWNKVKIKK